MRHDVQSEMSRRSLRQRGMIYWTGGAVMFAMVCFASGMMLASTASGPLLLNLAPIAQDEPRETIDMPRDETSAHDANTADAIEEIASPSAMDHDETPAPIHSASISAAADDEIRWFNGRPIRPTGTMTMLVTAYSPDERSCGKWADGVTASGYSVWTNGMNLVAADTSILPFGTLLSVPGYDNGNVVPVLDRGGAIKGKRLDVLYPTHELALQWGVQELEVTIWEYADGESANFRSGWRNR